MSERFVQQEQLSTRQVDLYVSGLQIRENDGSLTLITVNHIVDPLGGSKLLPTVVHQLRYGEELDVYSLDSNGNVLAHTNSQWVNGEEIATRDLSLARLVPYRDSILGMSELFVLSRARLSAAFNMYEQSQSDDSITPPDDAPQA